MLHDEDPKIFKDKDYVVVNDEIWKFFFAAYGGGP